MGLREAVYVGQVGEGGDAAESPLVIVSGGEFGRGRVEEGKGLTSVPHFASREA